MLISNVDKIYEICNNFVSDEKKLKNFDESAFKAREKKEEPDY
jgi:hypothetical protein